MLPTNLEVSLVLTCTGVGVGIFLKKTWQGEISDEQKKRLQTTYRAFQKVTLDNFSQLVSSSSSYLTKLRAEYQTVFQDDQLTDQNFSTMPGTFPETENLETSQENESQSQRQVNFSACQRQIVELLKQKRQQISQFSFTDFYIISLIIHNYQELTNFIHLSKAEF
jgi:hypothetical protein